MPPDGDVDTQRRAVAAEEGGWRVPPLHISRVGIWEWDVLGQRARWSDEMYRIVGLDFGCPAPLPLEQSSFFATASWRLFSRMLQATLASGRPFELDLELRRPDGAVAWVNVQAEAERDAAGRVAWLRGTLQDITARKEAELALSESQERFHQAFHYAGIGMCLTHLDGRILRVNPALCRLVGYSEAELTRMAYRDLSHPDDVAADADLQRRLVAGEIPHYELVKRNLRKDGRIVWLQLNRSMVRNEAGTPLYVITQVQDISERRAAEDKVRQLSRLYAAISAANQALLRSRTPEEMFRAVCRACVLDGSFVMAWVGMADPAARRIVAVESFGAGTEFLDGMAIPLDGEGSGARGPAFTAFREQRVCLCIDFAADPLLAPWRELASRHGIRASIALPLSRFGEPVGALCAYGRERGAIDGEAVKLLQEMAGNVSFALEQFERDARRVEAEERLKHFAEEIDDLYQRAPCGYHSVDSEGVFRRINDTELQWLGYTRDEVVGRRTIFDVLTAQSGQVMRDGFPALRDQGYVGDLDLEMLRKDGSVFPVLLSATALKDAEGRFLLSRSTVFDMTDRQRMEQERAAHGRHLRELSRHLVAVQEEERRRLSAELHDRTSPDLAAIRINLETLRAGLPDDLREELSSRLADTSALLEDATESIREVCADLRPPILDYAGLVPALEGYAGQFGRRTGIAVELDFRGFQGRLGTELESLLFRIVQEALTNSAKHAGCASVGIQLSSDGGRTLLRVADDGNGFQPDALGGDGIVPGLGLLTMRERAEFAGGRFRIESSPGGGTVITVEL